MNHRSVLNSLTSDLPLDESKKENEVFVVDEPSDAMEEETEQEASTRRRKQDQPTDLDILVKKVGWLLEAQRVAAETITNLCTNDDDGKNFKRPYATLIFTVLSKSLNVNHRSH